MVGMKRHRHPAPPATSAAGRTALGLFVRSGRSAVAYGILICLLASAAVGAFGAMHLLPASPMQVILQTLR